MNNYCMIQNSKTFAFSAENPTGVRAGGSQGGDCTKLRPTVTIPAGETVTLVDAAGPGVIQHMWFTGYVGHHFIIRMYWDDQEYPSVEAPLSAFFGCAYDENFVDRDGKYPVLNSAMMLVAPGRGYNSYFEMPFHKRARITMENRGDKDENLYSRMKISIILSPELIRRFRRRLVISMPPIAKSTRFRRGVPTQSLMESKAGDNLLV